jgi:hypothetical protein
LWRDSLGRSNSILALFDSILALIDSILALFKEEVRRMWIVGSLCGLDGVVVGQVDMGKSRLGGTTLGEVAIGIKLPGSLFVSREPVRVEFW